jgi:hypothetical protein
VGRRYARVSEKGSLPGHSLHITPEGCLPRSLELTFSLWTLRCLANYTAEQTGLRAKYEPVWVHLKAAALTELCCTSTRRKLRPGRRRPRIANLKDLVSGRRGSE